MMRARRTTTPSSFAYWTAAEIRSPPHADLDHQ
jgi:hypothetical protein